MKKLALFCFLFLVSILQLPAVYHTVGYYPGSGETGELAIHDNIGYLTAGSNGLKVLDLADPTNPTVIGSDSTGFEMSMIASDGDFAYVIGYTFLQGYRLQVFNVIQPQYPVFITSLGLPDWPQKMVLKDNLLFICWNYEDWQEFEFEYRMNIYNVSNPNAPVTLCSYILPTWINDFCVSGSRVYVADYQGLKILEITNPSSPQMIGAYYSNYGFNAIAAQDSLAFAVHQELKILNVQNPANPVLLSQLDSIWFQNMSVSGNTLFGMFDYGMRSVDISDPLNPVLNGYYYSGGGTLILEGNFAYISRWQNGVNIIDVSDPIDITQIGSVETVGEANAIYVDSGIAYVADGADGLKTFDVTDSSLPVLVGSLNTGRYFNDLFKSGDYVYLAGGYYNGEGGLEIVNVSNLASPSLMSYLPVQSYAPDIVVSGSLAYLADHDNGMKIFNISNPANPVLVSNYAAYLSGRALALSGNIICLVGPGSLDLVDVSNPSNPYLRGSIFTDNVFSVAAAGNVAYVADYSLGLLVIDISNPDSPVLLCTITPHAANNLFRCRVQGNRLYTSDNLWNEVLVYDITNPQLPVLSRRYSGNLNTRDFYAVGDLLYTANGQFGGVSIHDMNLMENDNPVLPPPVQIQLTNYPNPFNQDTVIKFNLPKTLDVSLDIYNLKGQKVRSLFTGPVSKGTHSFTWNRLNNEGRKVSSGIYIYRLKTPERTLTKRMLLLR